ncbi:hypothetical protein UlMin_020101 [Ulmus minor]
MKPLFILVVLGVQLVWSASAYYEPAGYRQEDQAVPSSNYKNYDPKDHDNDEDDKNSPKSSDGSLYFSLTVPMYSNEKKPSGDDDSLSPSYYYRSCPDFEAIVNKKVQEWVGKDYTLAPSLLRLHFHDCVVRGCDASILLNHEGSERSSPISKTLRGFEIIEEIKAEVEKKCPRTVSCADILTAAARDATVQTGGRYWTVDYGRRDGIKSIAEEAQMVPMGRETITDLIEYFQSLGLDIIDLVSLSGAHTIGRSSCESIQQRIYNYTGNGLPDASINENYLNFLQRKCRWASDYVDLDASSPKYFDNEYFINLLSNRKLGLLSTDQLLYSDSRTSYVVKTLAYDRLTFYQQFKKSMKKLGNVHVLTGNEGEIRSNCNFVNSPY